MAYCTAEAATAARRDTAVVKGHTMFVKLEGADFLVAGKQLAVLGLFVAILTLPELSSMLDNS